MRGLSMFHANLPMFVVIFHVRLLVISAPADI